MNKVKVSYLPVTASYTFNFISKVLQGGKNMVAFYSTLQRLPLIELCWKSRLQVDFKIESALNVSFITLAAGQDMKNNI